MLTITKESDYGILFLENLVGKKDFVSLSDLIKKTKLPKRFLARIASKLVKNKFVLSKEGKVGGYKLANDISRFTLYDFLKIFEKEVAVCHCLEANYCCNYEKVCRHQNFFRTKLNNFFIQELKRYSLKELLKVK